MGIYSPSYSEKKGLLPVPSNLIQDFDMIFFFSENKKVMNNQKSY